MKTIEQIKDCQSIDLGYNGFADLVLHPKKDMKMNHLNWCFERSIKEYFELNSLPKWIKVKDIPQPKEGCYWVIIDGELKTATVNSLKLIEDFKDDMDKSGFWDYSDYADDERLYPTHYLPYNEGLPKIPKHNEV